MSDRVGVCRRAFEAWNRKDIDEVVACYEADATIVLPDRFPDAGTLQGREEIKDFYAGFEGIWTQGSTVEPQAFHERGDLVIVPVASSVVARQADLGLDFDYTMVFSVPRELIARVEFHLGHEAAQRLIGESEEP